MKLKKLLISASAVAAGSGLLATVLTSCSKSSIDEDLIIDLNDDGDYVKEGEYHFDYKDALENALGRSSGWAQFKNALAEELIYNWYLNRAKDDDHPDRNEDFRNNLDDWTYDIKKDYDSLVDSCKSKYGANWKFYMQNEHLSPNGGTKDSYIHTKLVKKVKDDFISKVFKFNYFSKANATKDPKYPNIFTIATGSPSRDFVIDPQYWPTFGFYAKSNSAFKPEYESAESLPDYLSQNPDGDYATIQDYVFNRWFDTEKPFFSAAALFKYSNPAQSGGKLDNIYNSDWITVPENPNEAYPFFGGVTNSNGAKGTQAFWEWYRALEAGEFRSDGLYGADRDKYNQTVTMDSALTEDSQTLLLCTANDMFTGLYTPYAIAAANLYHEMFDTNATAKRATLNSFYLPEEEGYNGYKNQDQLREYVKPDDVPIGLDDNRLLSCFFYSEHPDWKRPKGITSYIDLKEIYPDNDTDAAYHCPIFKRNDNYTFLYGDMNETSATRRNGVQYIANNFEVQLGRANPAFNPGVDPSATNPKYLDVQPWVLEMNESGVHAQTIDGYLYVRRSGTAQTVNELKQNLKEVVMFRLMEDKCYDTANLISADLFGDSESAKLLKYFKDNFANIILEMSMIDPKDDTIGYYNIFRNVEDFVSAEPTLLLNKMIEDNHLGTLVDLTKYITLTTEIERRQRILNSIEAADSKIYEYRKTQIENSKSNRDKKRFENGLLAPIPLNYAAYLPNYGTTHHYYTTNGSTTGTNVIQAIVLGDEFAYYTQGGVSYVVGRTYVYDLVESVMETDFIKGLKNVGKNSDEAYSPQINEAKDVKSNRFWYKSPIVDQVMYSSMSTSTLANWIKQDTYTEYTKLGEVWEKDNYTLADILGIDPYGETILSNLVNDGVKATYIANKMLSGTNNFASYAPNPNGVDFYSTMFDAYNQKISESNRLNGTHNDDNLNCWLFLTTVAYLARNNFEKLYDSLSSKIHENELAFVAYVSEYDYINRDKIFPTVTDPTLPMNAWTDPATKQLPYDWVANVDNMYDKLGYSGEGTDVVETFRQSFAQYWHVVNKKGFFKATSTEDRYLSGFMGIQSASSNQLDEESKLKEAATTKFEVSTYKSPIDQTTTLHEQNDGVLFPWGYNGDVEKGAQKYAFTEISDPTGQSSDKINIDSFKKLIPKAMKLAYNIAQCSTIDDLRSMATSLSDAIYGSSLFSEISEGQIELKSNDPVQELKFIMLSELLGKGGVSYNHYFERLVNVELHTDPQISSQYSFRNSSTNECYKIMLTQLNKSDLVEGLITPKWTAPTSNAPGHWDMQPGIGLTLEEFWYIFFNAACDSTNQQSAIADAVKRIFGDNKLQVYDAQLYNQFDSTWIKDWKKKPMGE